MSEFREKPEAYVGISTDIKRKKFATQMDERLLENLRGYAKSEGRQLQSVLEEAVQAFLKEQGFNQARPDILDIAHGVMGDFSETLKYLAK